MGDGGGTYPYSAGRVNWMVDIFAMVNRSRRFALEMVGFNGREGEEGI